MATEREESPSTSPEAIASPAMETGEAFGGRSRSRPSLNSQCVNHCSKAIPDDKSGFCLQQMRRLLSCVFDLQAPIT
jgi:hypothetical protein